MERQQQACSACLFPSRPISCQCLEGTVFLTAAGKCCHLQLLVDDSETGQSDKQEGMGKQSPQLSYTLHKASMGEQGAEYRQREEGSGCRGLVWLIQ